MRDIILKAENLYFAYEGETSHSLNGLSLEIERGKKVAFMGANGSGKSTFSCAVMESTSLPQANYIWTECPMIIPGKGF